MSNFIKRQLARFPLGAALCYVAVVLAFVLLAAFAVLDVMERRDAVAGALRMPPLSRSRSRMARLSSMVLPSPTTMRSYNLSRPLRRYPSRSWRI